MKINVNKRNIKKLFLTLGVGAIVTYGSINSGVHIDKFTHMPDFYYINNSENNDISNEKFLDEFNEIIDSRKDLKEHWSDIRDELNDFILYNGENINHDRVLKMLKNLKITYNDDFSDLVAVTKYYNNSINYNARFNLKKSNQQKEIKLHEAFHFLFGKGFYGSMLNFTELGKALDEGTAQLLTEESGAYVNTTLYKKPSVYVKTMCELIGADKYFNDLNSNDVWKLVSDFSEYASYADSLRLLHLIDKSYIYYNTITEDDIEAWKIINSMYAKKTGSSLDKSNNEILKLYSNKYGKTNYTINLTNYYGNYEVIKNYFINVDEPIRINLLKSGEIYDTLYLDENNNVISDNKSFKK